MVALLFVALLAAPPPSGDTPLFVPRVLLESEQILAMATDGQYAYAQTLTGLMAWDGNGKGRPLTAVQGERDAGLAVDADYAYFIAGGKLWNTPTRGRAKKPQALATVPNGLGVAVDGGEVFFTDGETSQIFKMSVSGGPATALVTAGVEKQVRADSAGHGQAVVVDAQRVFWVFEDRVLSVPRAGGAASVLVRSPTLQPLVLAMDGDALIFADRNGVFRREKAGDDAPEKLLDCAASLVAAHGDQVYAACGPELVRVARDGQARVVLDVGPSEKSGMAVAGSNLFFADDQSGTIMPSLLVLPLGAPPVEPGSGKPGFAEAATAVRRFFGDMGNKDAAPMVSAPVAFHLGPDLAEAWSMSTTAKDSAGLRAVASELRGKAHPLLGFHTRHAWKLLPRGKIDADFSAAKKRLYKLAGKRTVLVSHRTFGGCPYVETIVAVDRRGAKVVPTDVYFESGYDCE